MDAIVKGRDGEFFMAEIDEGLTEITALSVALPIGHDPDLEVFRDADLEPCDPPEAIDNNRWCVLHTWPE